MKPKQHHKSEEEIKREREIETAKVEYERKKGIAVDKILSLLEEDTVQDALTFVDTEMMAINKAYQSWAASKPLSELDLVKEVKPDAPRADVYKAVLLSLADEKVNDGLTILNLARQEIEVRVSKEMEKPLKNFKNEDKKDIK